MPLSAITQSTKIALDPFVCFIYPDCSQQLTWDNIYPCLQLLIDPLFFLFIMAQLQHGRMGLIFSQTLYYTEAHMKALKSEIHVTSTILFQKL